MPLRLPPRPRPGRSARSAFRGDILQAALPRLLQGAVLTLELTALSLVLGVAGGLALALLRLSPLKALRPIGGGLRRDRARDAAPDADLRDLLRASGSVVIGLPSFAAGVLALSLNAAAYTSEIFRAGIESIDAGQMEAARSLGLDHSMAMRWVILPQTVRRVLPPLTNEAVALLKDSSLVSVVALAELMRAGKEIATDGGSPTTIYLSVALIYLAMTLPLTWLVRRLEARWGSARPRRVLANPGGRGVSILSVKGLVKRFGANEVLKADRSGCRGRRGGRPDRRVGKRQEHPAALPQPAGGADRRGRSRSKDAPWAQRGSTRSGGTSAWCSSGSTSSLTSPPSAT